MVLPYILIAYQTLLWRKRTYQLTQYGLGKRNSHEATDFTQQRTTVQARADVLRDGRLNLLEQKQFSSQTLFFKVN